MRLAPSASSIFVLLALGCAAAAPSRAQPRADGVRQISTLDALIGGAYESGARIDRLTGPNMIGLGTPNQLDGELIVLGEKAYAARVDETVRPLDAETRAPFAIAARFDADGRFNLETGDDYARAKERATRALRSANHIHAFVVEGSFQTMKVRSVPRQEPPYPPLTDVVEEQEIFRYTSIEGTMVGFRFPEYMERLNAPGYHFHFISDDRERGGHVLDFTVEEATLAFDAEQRFQMVLPEHELFRDADLSTHDETAVESVEKQ